MTTQRTADTREAQREQMTSGRGFIAALDQSGGSTPKALREYGIEDSRYSTDAEMFDLVHRMRARVISAPAFSGDRVLAAILFEKTMDAQIEGRDTADYLWSERGVVPFLKVDKGLADTDRGVQLMKDIPNLDDLLARAVDKGIYGTKMRSVIHEADPAGVAAAIDQQFEVAARISAAGLMPILEPEVSISSPTKADAETLLRDAIGKRLADLADGEQVMLKLTIPTEVNFYAPLIDDPRVQRVVALSGGYSRDEACELLAHNSRLIASFSRALLAGLTDQQTDAQFNATIEDAVAAIFAASTSG